ncbi:MAG: hypothetical protein WC312_00850 [Candidatus Omnitrophota bacterium]|jgi:hypothetical protein
MEKVFYEIDPFNRLIARNQPGRGSRVKKFRRVIYGKFRTDGNNNLFYEVNKSSGIDAPQKIKFSGRYSLDKRHNLVFTLNKWNNQCEGNRLTLKTKLISAESNEIGLLVNSRAGKNKSLTYTLRLYGSWQADKQNRLTFGIERGLRDTDILTLSGAWKINKNNEITYSRAGSSEVITFKGKWDIADKYKLNYILDRKTGSGFNFTASFGALAPKGKDVYAVFDIGIKLSGITKKPRRRIIFSGRLKMGKGKELILETSDIERGGLSLKFTKEMPGNSGMAYIESVFKEGERFIGGGIAFKW